MNVRDAHCVVALYLTETEVTYCRRFILGAVLHFLDLTNGGDDVALKDVNDKHQVMKVLSLGAMFVGPEGRDAKSVCNVVVFLGVD